MVEEHTKVEEKQDAWSEEITEPELKPHPVFQTTAINNAEQPAVVDGPIAWAKNILMGNRNKDTRPKSSEIKPTQEQNKNKDEDVKSLRKLRFRQQREKAMVGQLNEFPIVPKR